MPSLASIQYETYGLGVGSARNKARHVHILRLVYNLWSNLRLRHAPKMYCALGDHCQVITAFLHQHKRQKRVLFGQFTRLRGQTETSVTLLLSKLSTAEVSTLESLHF